MHAKHTPGPWRINEHRQLLAGKNGIHLFSLKAYPGLGFAEDANAQLIVGAPDLLAALKMNVSEYYSFMEREGYDSPEPEFITVSLAAIAKAGG